MSLAKKANKRMQLNNELNFYDTFQSVDDIGLPAKFTLNACSSVILHAAQCSYALLTSEK